MNSRDSHRTLRRRFNRCLIDGLRCLVLALIAVLPCSAAPAEGDALPPRPANRIVDEIGALTAAESEQLSALLAEAADRDDTQLYVLLVKSPPRASLQDFGREIANRWGGGWLAGAIVHSPDPAEPPRIHLAGPGEAAIGADTLRTVSRRVQGSAAREGEIGAQVVRCTADLLDELRQLRTSTAASHTAESPPHHSGWDNDWTSTPLSWLLAAPLMIGLVLIGVLSVRRLPSGPLTFPDVPHRERLAAPYAGGSAVKVAFSDRAPRSR